MGISEIAIRSSNYPIEELLFTAFSFTFTAFILPHIERLLWPHLSLSPDTNLSIRLCLLTMAEPSLMSYPFVSIRLHTALLPVSLSPSVVGILDKGEWHSVVAETVQLWGKGIFSVVASTALYSFTFICIITYSYTTEL